MARKPVADLKQSYPISMRWGIIGALLINIALFALAPKSMNVKPYQTSQKRTIIAEDIKLKVENLIAPPPEEKPAIPLEAESEEEVEAATMAETEFAEVYTRPEESVEIPVVAFWKVEKKPQPLYSPKPKYPEKARVAEMEGQAIVEALVDIDGKVIDVRLVKKSGFNELDQAAMNAARCWTFSPAEQRGKPVRVWVNIPFNFRLNE
ncbi:energy transducer TonB [candidate division WOR-3 bacterium]|nr:energy transducer TonB [candidate division WOR-3 bacterium]